MLTDRNKVVEKVEAKKPTISNVRNTTNSMATNYFQCIISV